MIQSLYVYTTLSTATVEALVPTLTGPGHGQITNKSDNQRSNKPPLQEVQHHIFVEALAYKTKTVIKWVLKKL